MADDSFTVGQRVTVLNHKHGVLRYLGLVSFAPGRWCGIELDESDGENDGSVHNDRYFLCKKRHGLFRHVSEVSHYEYTDPNISETEKEKMNRSYVLKPYDPDDVITQVSFDAFNDSLGIISNNLIMGAEVAEGGETSFADMLQKECCLEQDTPLLPEQENLNVTQVLYSSEQHDNLNLTKVIDSSEKCNMNVTQTIGSSIEQIDLNNTLVFSHTAEIEFNAVKKKASFNKEIFPSPVSTQPKILPHLKSEESPLHKTEHSPKYASTPKHEATYTFIFEDYTQIAKQNLPPALRENVHFVHGNNATCTSATCPICTNRSPGRNILNTPQTSVKPSDFHNDYNKTFINPLNSTMSISEESKRTVKEKNGEVDKTQVLNTTYEKNDKLTELPNIKTKLRNEKQHRMREPQSTKQSRVPRQVDCSPASDFKPIELDKKKIRKSMSSQSKNGTRDKLYKQNNNKRKSPINKNIASDESRKPKLKSPIYNELWLIDDPEFGYGGMMMDTGGYVPKKKFVCNKKPHVSKSKKKITGVKPIKIQQATAPKNSNIVCSDKTLKFSSSYDNKKSSHCTDSAAFENKSLVKCVKKPLASKSKKGTSVESIKTKHTASRKITKISLVSQSLRFDSTRSQPKMGHDRNRSASEEDKTLKLTSSFDQKKASTYGVNASFKNKLSLARDIKKDSIEKSKNKGISERTMKTKRAIAVFSESVHVESISSKPETGHHEANRSASEEEPNFSPDKTVNLTNLVTNIKGTVADKLATNNKVRGADKKSAKVEEMRVISPEAEHHQRNRPAVEEKQKFSPHKNVNLTKLSTNTEGGEADELTSGANGRGARGLERGRREKRSDIFLFPDTMEINTTRRRAGKKSIQVKQAAGDVSQLVTVKPISCKPETIVQDKKNMLDKTINLTNYDTKGREADELVSNIKGAGKESIQLKQAAGDVSQLETVEPISCKPDETIEQDQKNILLETINLTNFSSDTEENDIIFSLLPGFSSEESESSIVDQETFSCYESKTKVAYDNEKKAKSTLLPRLSSKRRKESQTSIQGQKTSSLKETTSLTIPDSEIRALEEPKVIFKRCSAAKCPSKVPSLAMQRPHISQTKSHFETAKKMYYRRFSESTCQIPVSMSPPQFYKDSVPKVTISKPVVTKKIGYHGLQEKNFGTSRKSLQFISSCSSYSLPKPVGEKSLDKENTMTDGGVKTETLFPRISLPPIQTRRMRKDAKDVTVKPTSVLPKLPPLEKSKIPCFPSKKKKDKEELN